MLVNAFQTIEICSPEHKQGEMNFSKLMIMIEISRKKTYNGSS